MNFASSAAGGIQLEIQDADGKPIPGFTLMESEPSLVTHSIELCFGRTAAICDRSSENLSSCVLY